MRVRLLRVDEGNRQGSHHGRQRDGQEVHLQRQFHGHQDTDHDRSQDGAGTAHAGGPADAGGAHVIGVELAHVGVGHDLRADGGSSGQADHDVQQRQRQLVAQRGDRDRRQGVEHDLHHLDVEAVSQPAATDGADHGTEVQHQHEGQGGTQAVAGVGHQLGEPGAQGVDHEQAHEEGDPEHDGAETAAFLEQAAQADGLVLVVGCGQREMVTLLCHIAGLDAMGNLLQIGVAALLDQVGGGFGQRHHHERHQDQRRSSGEEHGLPAIVGDQALAQHGSQHAAHGIAGEHQRHHGGADLARGVFGHVRHHVGQHAADAETGQEAHHAERDRLVRETGCRGEDAEQRDTDGDGPAAADLVGHGAEENGAEHHAEQGRAHHEAGVGGRHAHFLHDGRQGRTGHGQIVAVKDDDERTPDQNDPVEALKFRMVYQGMQVHVSHGSFPCCRPVVTGRPPGGTRSSLWRNCRGQTGAACWSRLTGR